MIRHERERTIIAHEKDSRSFPSVLDSMKVVLIKKTDVFLEADFIDVDCSVVNAIRRILISEVPTVSIEKVTVYKNSTVMPDEMLAHRLGLIPMIIDESHFTDEEISLLKFRLDARNVGCSIIDVLSDDITCEHGMKGIERWFKSGVLIAKLGPKQEISLEMKCQRGTGSEHAKWSPVCPATYRSMPDIKTEGVYDDDAIKLKSLFPDGVIGIDKSEGRLKAVVLNPRADTVGREVLRYEEFKDKVYIGRVPNHFIFTIESVFADPLHLLKKALIILIEKANRLKNDAISAAETAG